MRQYFQNEPITPEIAKRHGLIDRSYYWSKRFHKVTSRFEYRISLTLPTRCLISDQLSSHYSSQSTMLLLNLSHVLVRSQLLIFYSRAFLSQSSNGFY